ncbi:hypothetical protein V6N13_053818 [Hibiscus sabdariffa]
MDHIRRGGMPVAGQVHHSPSLRKQILSNILHHIRALNFDKKSKSFSEEGMLLKISHYELAKWSKEMLQPIPDKLFSSNLRGTKGI